MISTEPRALAHVTYRAKAGDREVALELAINPAMATVQDAWRRLSQAFAHVDPRTLEIEVHAP